VFLNDQPAHRLSLGSDKRIERPLRAQEGWVLPSGSDGICRFDNPLDVMMIGIDARILSEVGLTNASAVAPQIGAFDPLLLQMALNVEQAEASATLYRETMQHALAAHLAHILAPQPNHVHAIDDQRLAKAMSYIHDNLGSDLRLEDMAQNAAMSAFHFARAFKAETGHSPLQFVISARMDAAKVLLKTTRLPVAEIAHRVGYDDLSRFGKHFKARVGATPKVYRDS